MSGRLAVALLSCILCALPARAGVRFSIPTDRFTTPPARVSLAGSFTDWLSSAVVMREAGGRWEVTLPIPDGRHYYKYVWRDPAGNIHWMLDPDWPYLADNGARGANGVFDVKDGNRIAPKEGVESFHLHRPAEWTAIAGDFNEWRLGQFPMFLRNPQDSVLWEVSLEIRRPFSYRFIYDGIWTPDLEDRRGQKVPNGFGGYNSYRPADSVTSPDAVTITEIVRPGGTLAGLYPTLQTWPRRYFTNNTFWVGDPDMLHVNLPTAAAARAWASFVALSGGATMAGDDLTALPAERIEILKKALPAQGLTARPIDLFARPTGWAPRFPRIWDCKVERGRERYDVVGLFNWSIGARDTSESLAGEPQNVTLFFDRHLNRSAARRQLVYDFWEQAYVGAFETSLTLGLAPASCRVLVIRDEQSAPQVLGSDRHIVCGADDVKIARWQPDLNVFAGITETVARIPYALAIHVPAGWRIARALANGRNAAVEPSGPYFARVRFDTGPTGKVEWAILFERAATPPEPTADSVVSRIEAPPPPDPTAPEIALRDLRPLWTDQCHDIEAGPIRRAEGTDLGTVAPYWICWDVADYTSGPRRLVAEAAVTSESANTKIFFEVLGDGARLHATKILGPGQSAPIDVAVEGVKELTLICHYVDGWFSGTRGRFLNPRLVSVISETKTETAKPEYSQTQTGEQNRAASICQEISVMGLAAKPFWRLFFYPLQRVSPCPGLEAGDWRASPLSGARFSALARGFSRTRRGRKRPASTLKRAQ